MSNTKVFLIYEENHGVIGVCVNRVSCVIDYLIQTDWLSSDIVLFSEDIDEEEVTLRDLQKKNPNWKEYLQGLSIDDFNELFEGSFYLEEEEVFSE